MIDEITIRMPNQHHLLANLTPFGLENPNEVFIPTSEPYGEIASQFVGTLGMINSAAGEVKRLTIVVTPLVVSSRWPANASCFPMVYGPRL